MPNPYLILLLLSRTSTSVMKSLNLLSRFSEARQRKLLAQQQLQMQQIQMQQMQQMQQWQKMHQLQQMQSMIGGPMGRGVHMVRYQTIPSRAPFAQSRMMRPQSSQMMGRKKKYQNAPI